MMTIKKKMQEEFIVAALQTADGERNHVLGSDGGEKPKGVMRILDSLLFPAMCGTQCFSSLAVCVCMPSSIR